MASLTIRNLDDAVKHGLRVRAAQHGRSMEEEVREILRQAVRPVPSSRRLVDSIRSKVEPLGGIDLDQPEREPMAEPPGYD